jgi:hypothetical protein
MLVALLVIAGSVSVLIYFSGAKITLTPSMTSIPVETSLTAGTASEIPFTLITAKKAAVMTIPSTGTKEGKGSSSGTITIYNSLAKPQTLRATTRFSTSAGLVFKIPNAVTVPGGTVDKPGTVTATVVAAAPGASYDIGPSSFTLPGLAGTADANAVYARSSAPMTGGAAGPTAVVDPAAERSAVDSLKSSLASDLERALDGQVPEGYVLLTGAATTTYRALTPVASQTSGKADISVEGVVTGIVFPSAALASVIASSTLQGSSNTLGEGTALTLAPTSAFPSSDADSFSFMLTGTASLVSKIDAMQIATAVAGKSRDEAKIALTNYPEVKHAVLVLRPFWRGHFPEDPAAITVVVGDPTP